MKDIKQTLADNLRIYRKMKGLSQEKLGELCGLHRTYIGGIEQQNMNVSIANIGKIAHALEINPALLFMKPSDEMVNAANKRGHKHGSPPHTVLDELKFEPGDYALCTWEDDSVLMEPIKIVDPRLAIDILVSLIEQGLTDNLAQNFREAQRRFLELASSAQGPAHASNHEQTRQSRAQVVEMKQPPLL